MIKSIFVAVLVSTLVTGSLWGMWLMGFDTAIRSCH